VRNAGLARDLRSRRPPRIEIVGEPDAPPTVYYVCPDRAHHSGGVRTIYRHVDILNGLGISAAVLHTKRGFHCDWFVNSTVVTSFPEATFGLNDILVIPEWYGPTLDAFPVELRKVIFNQGAYHTFDHTPFAGSERGAPYAGIPNIVALLAVSADSEALLQHTFPHIPVHRARNVVEAHLFHPPQAPAGRRIAYTVRRRPAEREQLLHTLRARGVLEGWELVPIEGFTEAQAAEALRSCSLFFSFAEREGFGLPPAEAMASGCYVIGYTGMGGRELFDPSFCAPIDDGDLLAFAVTAEDAMLRPAREPEAIAKAGRVASEHVLSRYTARGLEEDLTAFYRPLLGKA
jgi:hypothetical protein